MDKQQQEKEQEYIGYVANRFAKSGEIDVENSSIQTIIADGFIAGANYQKIITPWSDEDMRRAYNAGYGKGDHVSASSWLEHYKEH